MKTVYVVMCKQESEFPTDWIAQIYETEEKAYDYIRECQKLEKSGRYSLWVEQWQVR